MIARVAANAIAGCAFALLLASCGSERDQPAPPDPDEQRAIAEAEEMITAGRPSSDTGQEIAEQPASAE